MTAKNLKADLVIVGGGGAGLAAAIAAGEKRVQKHHRAGKSGFAAGSTAMAHDVFGAESPVQKRQGSMLAKMSFSRPPWSGRTGHGLIQELCALSSINPATRSPGWKKRTKF